MMNSSSFESPSYFGGVSGGIRKIDLALSRLGLAKDHDLVYVLEEIRDTLKEVDKELKKVKERT